MKTVIALFATAAGAVAALSTCVFLFAASANSSPDALLQIKLMLAATAGSGLAGVVGAIVSLRRKRYRSAAFIGAAPVAFCVALIAILFAISA